MVERVDRFDGPNGHPGPNRSRVCPGIRPDGITNRGVRVWGADRVDDRPDQLAEDREEMANGYWIDYRLRRGGETDDAALRGSPEDFLFIDPIRLQHERDNPEVRPR
jgi:hypothetical protein